jgi:hypothetical protein
MLRKIEWAGATTALAALLGAAPGAFAADRVYGGSTSAGEAIVVTADKAGKKLRSAVVSWRAECADGEYFATGSALTPAQSAPGFTPGPDELEIKRNGKRRFAGTQHVGYGLGDAFAAVTVALDGRLGAKAASGTLSAEVAIIERATGNALTTCRTGRERWRAARAPGRIYAGKTSQDQPIVARLDAKRRRVTDVMLGWDSSSCQPEGAVHYPERLSNFRLASTGRFGDEWDATEPVSDGGSARTTYALTGRIARGGARGTLKIGVTWTDPAGAVTRTCDSGSVSWKAATG